ncbi:MerR family transcriptional regulator [Actinophytocola gossypii]|uniref:MerR family transcriptional regulator n=1 Tax=Actinophytocola gossypii TaxID=2812003 RepID=A0ABT2JHI4_9PSEU|nr:MerR family transcriptional regulator [Actinophytocola gossypii]MCT2587171.1 MerR family transcriptional regulator [Actinophytocola gossypii]
MGEHMRIGEVAERTGLSLRTIRYYEEVGLVVPSARSQGGFRLYAEPDIDRLDLVKRMKPLGFHLEEMRDLLDVLDPATPGAEPSNEQRAQLHRYCETAEQRCAELRAKLETAEEFAAMLRKSLEHRPAGATAR